jgi:hypothetical protein
MASTSPLRCLALGFCAALAVHAPARAGEPAPRTGILTFTFENDRFNDTDRYYTNGARVSWQSLGETPAALERAGSVFAPWLLPAAPVQWGVAIGQTMYTPRKRLASSPPRDDRPYAGHLYGTLAISSMTESRLGSVELSLGAIGRASGAEQVQDLIHGAIGVEKLAGWDRQIDDRPAALLTFEHRWQRNAPLGEALEVGVVPALGLSLGNVQTAASAGVLLRAGRNLALDFGPPRMRPALSGLAPFRPSESLGAYVFVGVEGRAVAYDATLDGNHHGYWQVDPKPLVGELPIGLELSYGRTRLAFSWVLQSATFDEQSRSPFQFGSASFSFAF